MENKEYYFSAARGLYSQTYDLIEIMAKDAADSLEKQGKKYDYKNLLIEFDVILQFSLVQVAISDNNFDVDELIFIRDLTYSGDFIQFLNDKLDGKLTWESMIKTDVSVIKKAINNLVPLLANTANALITIFAAFDTITPNHNFFDDFVKQITAILYALASVDGNVDDREFNCDCLICQVIGAIDNRKSEYTSEFEKFKNMRK